MNRFRVGLEEILVHRQDEREVVPAGIRLDNRLWRLVPAARQRPEMPF